MTSSDSSPPNSSSSNSSPSSSPPSSSATGNTPARLAPEDGRSPIVIYTDGACQGNPGPGGWGWAVAPEGEPFGSGGEPDSTNQRMEIYAALDALRTFATVADDHGAPIPVEIVSDSTYVVNCFRDKWWVKWERNGWRNSKKQPVANSDLWRPLIELVKAGDVSFRWVKGHSGDRMNDLVDALAVAAVPARPQR